MADMRRKRSRALLRSALLELLDEMPLDKVSVREVVERAGLSKRAFYNNYDCLSDLAVDCYHSILPHFDNVTHTNESYMDGPEAVAHLANDNARALVFLKEHPRLAPMVVDRIGFSPYFSQAWEAEVSGTAQFWGNGLQESGSGAAAYIDSKTCAQFIMAGANAIMRQWVVDGMREDVESVARKCILLGVQCGGILRGEAIQPEYLQAIEQWHFDQDEK